tara:strand:- start:93 stop:305 length:213 start_codon:yes stop_codon:yes gene_type:complete
MLKKKISSFKKIGYLKQIPKNADINDYESLLITQKNGKKVTLYKPISENKIFDNITNFNNSWKIFNKNLS